MYVRDMDGVWNLLVVDSQIYSFIVSPLLSAYKHPMHVLAMYIVRQAIHVNVSRELYFIVVECICS